MKDLHSSLDVHAKKYEIILEEKTLKRKFSELVRTLGQKINSVAVIIDEYDKPITSLIDKREKAELSIIELADF